MTGSESPVPRLSKTITRANCASQRSNLVSVGSAHWKSRCETQPKVKTRSIGPSPTTWYAMLTSPLLAY